MKDAGVGEGMNRDPGVVQEGKESTDSPQL